jgi:[ribosomal protein S5]-alanine N-acetyltransferase
LQPLRPDDLAALHAHWTEPEVRRYLWDGKVVSRAKVRDAIRTSEEMFGQHRTGLWGIRLLESAALVGCGGFWFFHEPPELELILSLTPASWGRGLATEAAGSLLAYAFDELRWPFVQASADAPNAASLKLLRRLGMRTAGERPGEFGIIQVFRITNADWRARQRAASPTD